MKNFPVRGTNLGLLVGLVTASALILSSSDRAEAARKRFYVVVADAEVAADVPPGLAAEAKQQLWNELAKRKDLVLHPIDQPVDEAEVAARSGTQKLKAYRLFARITQFRGNVEPPMAGKKYHTLSAGLRLTVIGVTIPGDKMTLSGDGDAEVTTEINGKEPTLEEKRELGKESLTSAVSQAARKAISQLKVFRPMKAPLDKRR